MSYKSGLKSVDILLVKLVVAFILILQSVNGAILLTAKNIFHIRTLVIHDNKTKDTMIIVTGAKIVIVNIKKLSPYNINGLHSEMWVSWGVRTVPMNENINTTIIVPPIYVNFFFSNFSVVPKLYDFTVKYLCKHKSKTRL